MPVPRPARRAARLAAACVLAGAAAGAAAAGTVSPRLVALGDDATYLEDTRGVLRWYGSLTDYPARGVLASGLFDQDGAVRRGGRRVSGPAAGAHLRPGGAAVGLWLADRGADTAPGGPAAGDTGPTATLLAGGTAGPAALGVAWRHGALDPGDAVGAPSAPRATDAVQDDLGLGARLDLGQGAYLDLAGEARLVRVETTSGPGGGTVTRRSGGAWDLRARAFVGLGPTLALTPVVDVRRAGETVLEGDRPVDLSGPAWRLGCGLTWLPDPDRLVLVAAEHRRADLDRTWDTAGGDLVVSTRSRVWTLRAAAELRGGAFWSVRLSAGATWTDLTDTHAGVAAGTWSARRVLVPVGVGLGAHLGRWDLDLALANHPPADGAGLRPAAAGDATWLSAALGATF